MLALRARGMCAAAAVLAGAAFFAVAASAEAATLALRDLTILRDVEIAGFDEDGVRLADGAVVTWDRIERASLDDGRQAEFDRLLAAVGDPLFRVRRRLRLGDEAGLLPYAQRLAIVYGDRQSESAQLVAQALVRGYLATGRPEAALEPYLRALELHRAGVTNRLVPQARRLALDAETGLSSQLPPFWNDQEAARRALPDVLEAIRAMSRPLPEGVRLYYASLALAAGETEKAEQALSGAESKSPLVAQLRDVLRLQLEVERKSLGPALGKVEASLDSYDSRTAPLAWYWLGRAKLLSDDESIRRDGLIHLLYVPALFGGEQQRLAAAALGEASQALESWGDEQASRKLRQELTQRYGAQAAAAPNHES